MLRNLRTKVRPLDLSKTQRTFIKYWLNEPRPTLNVMDGRC